MPNQCNVWLGVPPEGGGVQIGMTLFVGRRRSGTVLFQQPVCKPSRFARIVEQWRKDAATLNAKVVICPTAAHFLETGNLP